jgi:hypothetical protein
MKTCQCGRVYARIPAHARYHADAFFGGWYWECACKSTLFVRERKAA